MHPNETDIALTIPSEMRMLPVVRGVVEDVCQMAAFDSQARYDTVLAVSEACANIILHAHKQRRELPITMTCHLLPEGLEIRLRDQGERFDLAAVPEPDPTELRQGGRGVLLIRRLLDRVTSEHPADGGNVLRMFKESPALGAESA
jgi:serine/threonine-protein kinase RsbW